MATALDLAGGFGNLGLGSSEHQPELFADADDAPSSLTPAKSASGAQGGRPKGARNRSTEEWRKFLLSRFQSPAIGLAETWSRSAEDLARELHLTRVVSSLAPGQTSIAKQYRKDSDENDILVGYLVWDLERAFELQQKAREAMLPYLHQKQPMAVEISSPTRGLVIIGDLSGGEATDIGFALPIAPSEQNQQVIDAEFEKSDDEQSDALANALIHNEE